MICAKCGREMPDTDRFCGICGTENPLFNTDPVQEQRETPVSGEQTGGDEISEYINKLTEPVPGQEEFKKLTEDLSVQENTDTPTDDIPAGEYRDAPIDDFHAREYSDTMTEELPVQEYTAGIRTNVARVQSCTPYTQAYNAPPPEYRPFAPNITPPPPPQKVKRTCSLSAVIFCAVVIFLLSIACGIFAGLYFSVKPNPPVTRYSITEQAKD